MQTRRFGLVALAAVCLGALGRAQVTTRASVDSNGVQGNSQSYRASLSADGRYVAFTSNSSNLVAGDTNGAYDVFVHDCLSGTTECASLNLSGVPGGFDAVVPSISGDGRYVVFQSLDADLVTGDTNGFIDIFVRDRQNGTTERVSVSSTGVQANQDCGYPSISADGRYVAFASTANNLVASDTNAASDVFVHDRQTGATERVSVSSAGLQGNLGSGFAALSGNGRYAAFQSDATDLVANDINGSTDIFVRDRQNGTTERASLDSFGQAWSGDSRSPSISGDGRFVAFESDAAFLVPNDTNTHTDIFVHDSRNGTTERVSVNTAGVQGDRDSDQASISADGLCVAFYSAATNFYPGDTNLRYDAFVHDRQSGVTECASVNGAGAQGDYDSFTPSISADGNFVGFQSYATNLVAGDTNVASDIFVRERVGFGMTILCSPGGAGTIGCPCSNPPSGAGRGCDNSSATGGASISSTGVNSLAAPSLVFTTAGERPTATSILLQGSAGLPAGIAFGQGVRCSDGPFKRLYIKTAVAGSITAPDGGAGDLDIPARSMALGDTILAGQARWYMVYYRDPNVLGGCAASATFNATDTEGVQWQP
jgi:Tol biopolymer transport system component